MKVRHDGTVGDNVRGEGTPAYYVMSFTVYQFNIFITSQEELYNWI